MKYFLKTLRMKNKKFEFYNDTKINILKISYDTIFDRFSSMKLYMNLHQIKQRIGLLP